MTVENLDSRFRLFEKMQRSKSFAKFLQEDEKARAEQRAELVGKLQSVEAKFDADQKKANARFTRAQADFDDYVSQGKAIGLELAAARRELQSLSVSRQRHVAAFQLELNQLADDRIATFVADLWAEIKALQVRQTTLSGQAERNAYGFVTDSDFASDYPSQMRRIEACRDAISKAEAMRYQSVPDLDDELEALRNQLPEIVFEKCEPMYLNAGLLAR